MLQSALAVQEEEQLIFDDRSANVGAFLVALPGGWDSLASQWVVRCRQVGGDSAVAEQAEGLAVERVGARLGGHVHRAGGSQIVRKIQAGLGQREFLNRARRDVFSRRAHGLVADVNAIDVDTSRSAEPAAE